MTPEEYQRLIQSGGAKPATDGSKFDGSGKQALGVMPDGTPYYSAEEKAEKEAAKAAANRVFKHKTSGGSISSTGVVGTDEWRANPYTYEQDSNKTWGDEVVGAARNLNAEVYHGVADTTENLTGQDINRLERDGTVTGPNVKPAGGGGPGDLSEMGIFGDGMNALDAARQRSRYTGDMAVNMVPTVNDYAMGAQGREAPQVAGPNYAATRQGQDIRSTAMENQAGMLGQARMTVGGAVADPGARLGKLARYQEQVARGEAGPSVAEAQLAQGRDRSIENAMAMANSGPGGRFNPAAQRAAIQEASRAQTDFESNAAQLRAREQQEAAAQAGQLFGSQAQVGTTAGSVLGSLGQQYGDQAQMGISAEKLAMSRADNRYAADAANADRTLRSRQVNDAATLGGLGVANQTLGVANQAIGTEASAANQYTANALAERRDRMGAAGEEGPGLLGTLGTVVGGIGGAIYGGPGGAMVGSSALGTLGRYGDSQL